jgi:hypothetical protein
MIVRFQILMLAFCLVAAQGFVSSPAFASGSFFDTIQSAEEQKAGRASEFEQQEPAPEEVAPDASTDIQFQISTTKPQAVKIIISNIIQTIIKKTGIVNLGKKIVTIFLPPGTSSGRTTNQPTSGTTGQTTTTKPTGTGVGQLPPAKPKPPTNTPPVATGALDLRDQIRAYGIDPVNGDTKWTDAELKDVLAVLTTLPAAFRSCTKTIKRDHNFQGNTSVLGYVRMGIPTVYMLDGASKSSALFQRTLVHEMTHTFQSSNRAVAQNWQSEFWQNGRPVPPSVTAYGNSQVLEDMAESVAVYFQNPGYMKSQQAKRYEFIKKFVMDGKEF